jgi:hypothetical protein
VTRLFRLLAILAFLLAPAGMIGGAPAVASAPAVPHHDAATAAPDRCAGMEEDTDRPSPRHDCAMACAAIPPLGSVIGARPLAPSVVDPVRPATFGHGLGPEAATPPPRTA